MREDFYVYWLRFGRCAKGPLLKFIHLFTKVCVCKSITSIECDFLLFNHSWIHFFAFHSESHFCNQLLNLKFYSEKLKIVRWIYAAVARIQIISHFSIYIESNTFICSCFSITVSHLFFFLLLLFLLCSSLSFLWSHVRDFYLKLNSNA